MAVRLLVNVPPYQAGSRIEPGQLDEVFVQSLIDAGQAEEVEADAPADPADAALVEVFELEDQLDAAISRRARVVMLIDGLDEDDRAKVERALETASRVRPELFGWDTLPDTALLVATELGFADTAELVDRAEIGRALLEALPKGFDYTDTPVEFITIQADKIADLETARKLDAERIETLTEQLTTTSAELVAAETKLATLAAQTASSTVDPPPADAEVKGKKPPRA